MGQSDLPLASGEKHAACFQRLGWKRDTKRRGRGSHILLTKKGQRATLSIPDHHEVKRALLAKLIAAAGITQEDYLKKFKK
jgi:predicted RNA binding protein YcfA (HicA-like mRNA interferase family)